MSRLVLHARLPRHLGACLVLALLWLENVWARYTDEEYPDTSALVRPDRPKLQAFVDAGTAQRGRTTRCWAIVRRYAARRRLRRASSCSLIEGVA